MVTCPRTQFRRLAAAQVGRPEAWPARALAVTKSGDCPYFLYFLPCVSVSPLSRIPGLGVGVFIYSEAPDILRNSTTSMWPFIAAKPTGVVPLLVLAFTSAPLATSSLTTSS